VVVAEGFTEAVEVSVGGGVEEWEDFTAAPVAGMARAAEGAGMAPALVAGMVARAGTAGDIQAGTGGGVPAGTAGVVPAGVVDGDQDGDGDLVLASVLAGVGARIGLHIRMHTAIRTTILTIPTTDLIITRRHPRPRILGATRETRETLAAMRGSRTPTLRHRNALLTTML
jgi:hypothetical protein